MSYNPIVVILSSLKPFFFNGLKKELCFSNNAWSIRPRNPIRAKKNYANALLEQEQANAARSRQEEDKRNLESQRECLIKERDTALAALSDQMMAAIPDLVEQAVVDIRQKKDTGFNFAYEREKTALENYQAHRYIALEVSHWLEARFPERFEEVRK